MWKHVEMYGKIVPLLKNFKNLFPRAARAPMEIPILDAACVTTTYLRESQSENGAAPLVIFDGSKKGLKIRG